MEILLVSQMLAVDNSAGVSKDSCSSKTNYDIIYYIRNKYSLNYF